MGAQGCAKEAEHKESASQSGLGIDRLLEDTKAQMVGQNRCRVAQRMAHWAATKDDKWQTGAENKLRNPAPDIPSSTNVALPAPLLDGGQGKRSSVKMTDNEGADGGGVEAEKRSEGDSKTGNKGNKTTEILSNKQPNLFAGALRPTNSLNPSPRK